jgi:hypothetical protein
MCVTDSTSKPQLSFRLVRTPGGQDVSALTRPVVTSSLLTCRPPYGQQNTLGVTSLIGQRFTSPALSRPVSKIITLASVAARQSAPVIGRNVVQSNETSECSSPIGGNVCSQFCATDVVDSNSAAEAVVDAAQCSLTEGMTSVENDCSGADIDSTEKPAFD